MIRKISSIVTILLLSTVAIQSQAQICTPDTNLKTPGFLPLVLPGATVNTAYSQGITVYTLKDTTAKQGGFTVKVTIDSMKLIGFTGFPPGVSYQCLSARCLFLPTALSCIKVSGTPTQSGIFPLKAIVKTYAKISGILPQTQTDTVKTFVLTVTGSNSTLNLASVEGMNMMPNPASNSVYIHTSIRPIFYSATGQLVNVPLESIQNGYNANTSALPKGIYWVKSGSVSGKLIIE